MPMHNRYDQPQRFSATGVTTGSILVVIVALAISLLLDLQTSDRTVRTAVAHTASAHA
jgi:hypothetical protein